MDRRKFVTGSAAVIGAASLPRTYAQAQAAPDKIRVGYAISISGPLGAGAENTAISQYKLWQKRVNDAGGITLKKFNKKVPIEMIEYDDRGQPDELIKLTERLDPAGQGRSVAEPLCDAHEPRRRPDRQQVRISRHLHHGRLGPDLRAGAATGRTCSGRSRSRTRQRRRWSRCALLSRRRARSKAASPRSTSASSRWWKCTRRSSTPPRRPGSRSCSTRTTRSAPRICSR